MASSVQGLDKLLRQMKALPAAQKLAAEQALAQGAAEIAQAVQRAAPNEKLAKTAGWSKGAAPAGALGAGPKVEGGREAVAAEGLAVTVHVGGRGSTAENASWAEYGTKPHVIAPKNRKVLKLGRRFVTGGVEHPGAKAQPFFWPTIRAQKQRAKSRVVRNANRAVKAAVSGA